MRREGGRGQRTRRKESRREKIRLETGGEKQGKVASEEERRGGSKRRCDYFGKRCRDFFLLVSEWKTWGNRN